MKPGNMKDMTTTSFGKHFGTTRSRSLASGFSLIEMMIVAVVFTIVLGGVLNYVNLGTQRSKVEQTKVDLTQEGREFVDEFERDIHQSGYPNCRMFNTGANCPSLYNNSKMAVGLAFVSNTNIVMEGDVDGDGVVDSVQYQVVDSAGNNPPTGTCPCRVQRSQVPKVNGTAPLAQATSFTVELDNVVNSGVPGGTNAYGNGLQIAGNVLFNGGAQTNTQYYAAVSTFKDYPVFQAYDQNGTVVPLPLDITTAAGQAALASIKSIRLTVNLLGSATSGYDGKTGVRPVVTLIGNGKINN